MFTGIIEELGTVIKVEKGSNSSRITIAGEVVLREGEVRIGDSIAVNGVCLTVVQFNQKQFCADVMAETLAKSSLKEIRSGDRVNLERALRLGDRMGGHLVQGHVDGTGFIASQEKNDIARLYWIKTTDDVLRYMVPKGSVAIDGISLTLVEVRKNRFCVSLIPHTAANTTLGFKKNGSIVNLETDIIGRYVERWLNRGEPEKNDTLSMGFLAENGFM